MGKCTWGDGIKMTLDGVNELDPCVYEEVARYKNVTVIVSRCRDCGTMDISWIRQENTEELEPYEDEE